MGKKSRLLKKLAKKIEALEEKQRDTAGVFENMLDLIERVNAVQSETVGVIVRQVEIERMFCEILLDITKTCVKDAKARNAIIASIRDIPDTDRLLPVVVTASENAGKRIGELIKASLPFFNDMLKRFES